jgi:mannose-6-phosphate isomerase-like protein (cupin superfamily)
MKVAFALLLFIGLTTTVSADPSDHGTISPDKLVWGPTDPNQPSAPQIAVLYGDPAKAGPFGIRLKIPAGFEFPSHTHSQVEYVTIISGKAKVAWGIKADPMTGDDLGPGSFFWMKNGYHHSLKAIDDVVLELHSATGPLDMAVDK